MPFSDLEARNLEVRYRESGPSNIIAQGLQCAHNSHLIYLHIVAATTYSIPLTVFTFLIYIRGVKGSV